ncbi:MAG: aspartyl protease family protein [Planctomycetota bacterium]
MDDRVADRDLATPGSSDSDSKGPLDRREFSGLIGRVEFFGSNGDKIGKAPAVLLGRAPCRILVPLHFLSGAYSARALGFRGPDNAVQRVYSRLPGTELALLTLEGDAAKYLEPVTKLAAAGERVWLLSWTEPESSALDRRSGRVEGPSQYLRRRTAFDLDGAAAAVGAVVIRKKDGRVCGLIPALRVGEPAKARRAAFGITADLLEVGERIDLSLGDYQRQFYEGSVAALLARATKALAERRYEDAIEAFRRALRLDTSWRPRHDKGWLAAHAGILDDIPRTRRVRRLLALDDALLDFPDDVSFLLDLADTALAHAEYRRALEAFSTAWSLNSQRVGNLDVAKTGVYRRWADALVAKGRLEDALAVLEEARREVNGDAVMWALYGDLLLKVRDYATAAAAFEDALALDPARADELNEKAKRAYRFAEGPGKVVIDYRPGSRSIIAEVTINGRFRGEFIIDTGATSSFVPEILGRRAGLDLSNRVPHVRVQTAGNERRLPYTPVSSLGVGALQVANISVIVGDLPGTGQRGLLGMDFLGKFGFENDSQNGRFVIFEKR